MDSSLDEIDKEILFHLSADARHTSATDIAEEVNVSAQTVRNRVRQLEEAGVIRGYHAHVDYERGERLLTNLFTCTTGDTDREKAARQVLRIPGVINVREVMTGHADLHATAVGADTEDLTGISRAITELGIEIEEEDLVRREYFSPYDPYGPEGEGRGPRITDFMSLSGDAEVAELSVSEDAPVAGRTLREANEEGLFDDDVLIVAIEREGETLTPHGETEIHSGDVVTVFARRGLADDLAVVFSDAEPVAN